VLLHLQAVLLYRSDSSFSVCIKFLKLIAFSLEVNLTRSFRFQNVSNQRK